MFRKPTPIEAADLEDAGIPRSEWQKALQIQDSNDAYYDGIAAEYERFEALAEAGERAMS